LESATAAACLIVCQKQFLTRSSQLPIKRKRKRKFKGGEDEDEDEDDCNLF
jgi:hypothetical protein